MKRAPLKHRFQLSWRYLFEKKARVFLTFLGVTIGVATIFAIAIANETTLHTFEEMINDATGRADLEVVAATDDGLPATLTSQLGNLPLVNRAVPVVSKQVMLLDGDQRTLMLMMGIDPAKDPEVRHYVLAQGRVVQNGKEVVLVADSGAAAGNAVGKEATFLTAAGPVRLTVVGLLKKEGPARYQDGAVSFVPLTLAQQLFGLGDRVSTIQLVVKEGAALEAAKESVQGVIPPSALVQFPASRGQSASQWLTNTTSGLTYASYLSIVLGGFIIFNTFSMTVAERRRDLSILRALGTSKRQVRALVLIEALLIGTAGTLAGMGLGIVLAKFFIVILAQFAGTTAGSFSVPWSGVLASLIAGIGVSLVSTYFPARRATAVSPLEGMRPAVSHGDRASVLWMLIGLPVAGLGLILFVVYLFVTASVLDLGMLGVTVFLIGCVLILPSIYAPLLKATGVILRRMFPTTALLAERNLLRTETRNALTIGVLMLAVTVTVGIGAAVQSGLDGVARWQNSTLSADFFLRGSIVDPGGATSVQLGEGLESEILRVPGVGSVDKLRFIKADGPDGELIVLAKSFNDPAHLRLTLETGDEEAVRAGLQRGEIVVSTTLAKKYNLNIGSGFPLQTKNGRQTFRVAGINSEYTNGGNALYMEWNTAQRELGATGVDAFYVQAGPGSDLKVLEQELAKFAKDRGLILQSARDLHEYVNKMVNSGMSFYWAIGFIGLAVASLGIVNTLTTNVIDRWREIAMLRAVAATKRQVRRLIVVEALFLGLIAAVTGGALGSLLAYIFVEYQNRLNGYTLAFSWQWPLILGVAVLSVLIALLASLVPAHRATKVNMVMAIKHE